MASDVPDYRAIVAPFDSNLLVSKSMNYENGSCIREFPDGSNRENRHSRKNKPIGLLGHIMYDTVDMNLSQWSPKFLIEHQRADTDIAHLRSWLIEKGERPPWHVEKSESAAVRGMWQQYDSMCVINGVAYRKFHQCDSSVHHYQCVLPASLKTVILQLCHADAVGHLKVAKTIEHVQRRARWFLWRRSVKLFVAACRKCCQYHRGSIPKRGFLHPLLLGGPTERWEIDLLGPFPPSNGFKFLFTALDPFSKFGIAILIRHKDASTVVNAIVDNIFVNWGLPFELLHDQNPEFEATLSKELFFLLEILALKTCELSHIKPLQTVPLRSAIKFSIVYCRKLFLSTSVIGHNL